MAKGGDEKMTITLYRRKMVMNERMMSLRINELAKFNF